MSQGLGHGASDDVAAMAGDVGGYDVSAVTAWMEKNVEELRPPFAWSRFAAGHSNLTFSGEYAGGRQAVIRQPPLGVLQPKVHDTPTTGCTTVWSPATRSTLPDGVLGVFSLQAATGWVRLTWLAGSSPSRATLWPPWGKECVL